jgi:hypothetical protein
MEGARYGDGKDDAFHRQRFLEGLILSAAPEPNRAELAATIRAIYSHIDEPKFVDGVNVELCRCYELLGVSFADMMNYQGWRIGPEMLARVDREVERQAAARATKGVNREPPPTRLGHRPTWPIASRLSLAPQAKVTDR